MTNYKQPRTSHRFHKFVGLNVVFSDLPQINRWTQNLYFTIHLNYIKIFSSYLTENSTSTLGRKNEHLTTEISLAWLRRLVATLSAPRPGLDHRPVHVRLVVDKVASGRSFPGKSVFPCHCYSSNSPNTCSSTHCSYQKDKEPKTKYLRKQCSVENREALHRILLLHLSPGK
jgi:hypothetical protein